MRPLISLSVIFLLLGLLAGLARGGRVDNIWNLRFRYPWLLVAGVAVQVGGRVYDWLVSPSLQGSVVGTGILAASYSLLIAFGFTNRDRPGAVLIGGGLALNMLVIVVNGGMPVSLRSASAAGFDPSVYLQSSLKHHAMSGATKLSFLADVIPIPGLKKVVSIGDLVMGAGIFFLVESSVRYRPRRLAGLHDGRPGETAAQPPSK